MAAKHRLRGLPAPRRAAGRRRLPAPPADLPRQPARLLAGDRRPRPRGLDPHLGFRRERHRPHPLYAIGVFLSFTLSQAGMAHRWWKSGRLRAGELAQERGSVVRHDRRWLPKMVVNGFGAGLTAVVTVVFAVTKFRDGAWVVLVVIPALVSSSTRSTCTIATWRAGCRSRGSAPAAGGPSPGDHPDQRGPPRGGGRADVRAGPLGGRHGGLLSTDPALTEAVEKKWGLWGGGVRLVVVNSPLPAAGRAARGVHPRAGRAPPAERGDHGGRPPVRAAAAVAQRAARPDRDDAAAWRWCSSRGSSSRACPTRWAARKRGRE